MKTLGLPRRAFVPMLSGTPAPCRRSWRRARWSGSATALLTMLVIR
jgi:hypothetical protein